MCNVGNGAGTPKFPIQVAAPLLLVSSGLDLISAEDSLQTSLDQTEGLVTAKVQNEGRGCTGPWVAETGVVVVVIRGWVCVFAAFSGSCCLQIPFLLAPSLHDFSFVLNVPLVIS